MAGLGLGVDGATQHDLHGGPPHPLDVGLDPFGAGAVLEVRRDHPQLVGAARDRGDEGRDGRRHQERRGALGEEAQPAEPGGEPEGDRGGGGAAERREAGLVGQGLLQGGRVGHVLALGGGPRDHPPGERPPGALERVGERRGRDGAGAPDGVDGRTHDAAHVVGDARVGREGGVGARGVDGGVDDGAVGGRVVGSSGVTLLRGHRGRPWSGVRSPSGVPAGSVGHTAAAGRGAPRSGPPARAPRRHPGVGEPPSTRARTRASVPWSSMAAVDRCHMARNISSPRSVTPAVRRPSRMMSGPCSSPST